MKFEDFAVKVLWGALVAMVAWLSWLSVLMFGVPSRADVSTMIEKESPYTQERALVREQLRIFEKHTDEIKAHLLKIWHELKTVRIKVERFEGSKLDNDDQRE